jgi:hypothetical protein
MKENREPRSTSRPFDCHVTRRFHESMQCAPPRKDTLRDAAQSVSPRCRRSVSPKWRDAGRVCLAIELELYIDVAIRLWQAFTGRTAVRLATVDSSMKSQSSVWRTYRISLRQPTPTNLHPNGAAEMRDPRPNLALMFDALRSVAMKPLENVGRRFLSLRQPVAELVSPPSGCRLNPPVTRAFSDAPLHEHGAGFCRNVSLSPIFSEPLYLCPNVRFSNRMQKQVVASAGFLQSSNPFR